MAAFASAMFSSTSACRRRTPSRPPLRGSFLYKTGEAVAGAARAARWADIKQLAIDKNRALGVLGDVDWEGQHLPGSSGANLKVLRSFADFKLGWLGLFFR